MAVLFTGTLMAASYTVAGDNTTLFGTAWDPSNTANDMTLVSGNNYQWAKTDVTLAAGTVNFKVTVDHSWSTCYPSGPNESFSIPEGGVYDVTITFNSSSHAISATATKKAAAVVIPTIAMHGNFTGTWADTQNFTEAEGSQTATLQLTLTAENYEFGMRIGGSGNWTANGSQFTRANNSHAITSGSGKSPISMMVFGTQA